MNKVCSAVAMIMVGYIAGCAEVTDLRESVTSDSAAAPSRLFLQQISSDGVVIKWRGNAQQACIDGVGCRDASQTEGGHKEVRFDGLQADTRYQYRIGDYQSEQMVFRTAPITGQQPSDGNVRLWLLGDSGTASYQDKAGNYLFPGEAQKVVDGFKQFSQGDEAEPIDLMLLLGDNAYTEGTDAQWQKAVFELYTDTLPTVALWPTIGNHEMGGAEFEYPGHGTVFYGGTSVSADPDSYVALQGEPSYRIPYLDIFTLPTKGEVGGVASGTEQYYSFDYGNVHVVSLDSQLSARDEIQRSAMREWLIADLESNQLDWTIVIFHHPPYTKGSHDSDTEPSSKWGIDQPIIDMREEFTPVFEDYGVDLVYSGHSHSYERSWYLHGHRGDADTFDASRHAELNTSGEPAKGYGNEPYQQISTGSNADDKVVYTVAGSSGFVKLGHGKLDHPAHAIMENDAEKRHGLAEMGSVVVDAGKSKLIARFLNDKGLVLDTVVIKR